MLIKSLWNSNPRRSAGFNNVALPDHQIAEVYYITGRRNDDYYYYYFGSKKSWYWTSFVSSPVHKMMCLGTLWNIYTTNCMLPW